jgi:hypothetical protein
MNTLDNKSLNSVINTGDLVPATGNPRLYDIIFSIRKQYMSIKSIELVHRTLLLVEPGIR